MRPLEKIVFDEKTEMQIIHQFIDGRYFQDGIHVEEFQILNSYEAGVRFPIDEVNEIGERLMKAAQLERATSSVKAQNSEKLAPSEEVKKKWATNMAKARDARKRNLAAKRAKNGNPESDQ